MAEIRFNCFSCGHELVFGHMPGRRDECIKCHADAHVCRNCKNYDPKVYNECRETQAEVVKERDRSNFCDYFDPAPLGGATGVDKQAELKAAAEALFKNFKK